MNPHLRATFRDIWDGIRAQPGRIGLSFMAIGVGIMALTVLVAVLQGLEQRSRTLVKELGANVVAIVPGGTAKRDQEATARLEERHADYLAANLPDCHVAGMRMHDVPMHGSGNPLRAVACDPRLLAARGWTVSTGRFLDSADVRRQERHAVITRTLSRTHNWSVGDVITLKTTPFRVVGVLDIGGGPIETDAGTETLVLGESVVFVPLSLPTEWIVGRSVLNPPLNGIFIRAPGANRMNQALHIAQRLLRHPDYRVNGLSWITPDFLLRRIRRLQTTIKLTVGSIAVLCLILGGTTLMSLMIANVRDRVSEIGLRRALGATPRDIALLFVVEASLVTLTAGLAGTILTHLFLFLARPRFPVPIDLGLTSFLLPVLTALVLGATSSYWPARAAARITPSDALRND